MGTPPPKENPALSEVTCSLVCVFLLTDLSLRTFSAVSGDFSLWSESQEKTGSGRKKKTCTPEIPLQQPWKGNQWVGAQELME